MLMIQPGRESMEGEWVVNLRQIRWPVVLLVMAGVLGGLFGVGFLLKSQTVDQPLNAMLSQTAQVESFTVHRIGEKHEIRVRFRTATDLKAGYTQLDQEVAKILRTVPYEIKVEDLRTPDLEAVANRMDLYVQEALVTGQFAVMADRVEAEAQKVGAVARIGVDGDRVYLSLTKGDGYLYSVFSRAIEQPLRKEGGFGL